MLIRALFTRTGQQAILNIYPSLKLYRRAIMSQHSRLRVLIKKRYNVMTTRATHTEFEL